MADMRTVITEAKLDAVHQVYVNGKNDLLKFLCFTRLVDENWILAVTDGVDMWRSEIDMDELDSHRDLSGVSSMDAFLTKFRNGFASGNLCVSRIGTKATLTVGAGTAALNFDLYESKAADKKAELQTVLFRLADMTSDLESQLNVANSMVKDLKAQRAAGGGGKNALFDLGPKKGANPAKAKPKKAGMSRKRKAAKGVEFD